MSSQTWLQTPRLSLRRFTEADRDWMRAYYADEEATRFLGGVKTPAQVDDLFNTRILDFYDSHPGLGVWATIERATGARVGFHLLNHPFGETSIQIGYALVKEAWERGYGTEMAAALVRYGFVDLHLPRIVAIASLGNVASHRVLEKIGLHRLGERTLPHPAYADEGPMAWFERDGADWIAERAAV